MAGETAVRRSWAAPDPPAAGARGRLVDHLASPEAQRLRLFLTRDRVPYEGVDLDRDPLARLLIAGGAGPAGGPRAAGTGAPAPPAPGERGWRHRVAGPTAPPAPARSRRPPRAGRPARDAALERLLLLVDGVFAIALTLLAVELRLPEAAGHAEGRALLEALLGAWPRVLGFATSFTLLAIYWAVHHRLFQFVRRLDARLLWLSLAQLGCVAFLPFPTAVVGAHPADAVAAGFYFVSVLGTSAAFAALWGYASGGHRLVDPALPPRVVRHYWRLILGGVLAPALLLGLVALGVQRLVSPLLLSYLVVLGYVVLGVLDWREPAAPAARRAARRRRRAPRSRWRAAWRATAAAGARAGRRLRLALSSVSSFSRRCSLRVGRARAWPRGRAPAWGE
jgi:uncharacterized membrane protein